MGLKLINLSTYQLITYNTEMASSLVAKMRKIAVKPLMSKTSFTCGESEDMTSLPSFFCMVLAD